jgi:DNA repair protein RecN (Recombination protein N)
LKGLIFLLSKLHIENVAVIENADLELEAGLNVLTGETGAGKSILIDSINLVLGERVSKDIVRSGQTKAHVSALFVDVSQIVCEQLAELGFECDDDGSLLIQREITADGKGSCRISGRLATASLLREIGRLLVNTHGQHDNQALLSAEKHITYLDSYADLNEKLAQYRIFYSEMNKIKAQIEHLQSNEAEKARRIDLLLYQIDDIEKSDLKPDEDEQLHSQKNMIVNSEKISQSVGTAYTSLSGTENGELGAQELLSAACEALRSIMDVYPEIKPLFERLSEATYEIVEVVSDLRAYTGDIEYDPRELDNIELRLDTIFRLKKKYGNTIEQIFAFLKESKTELEALLNSQESISKLEDQLVKAEKQARQEAAEITENRVKAATVMQQKIKDELVFLDMPGVEFFVNVEPCELYSGGAEKVEFLISANPGSPPKPLSKIASGGELSRVMLGIKNVIADNDDIETSIFDEIDTGVSGRAAQKIGMKLKQVSKGRQIVCVTHLAQIAAQADRHTLIEKQIKDGNTFTILKTLEFDGRKKELARIMGGVEITHLMLQNAEEMLLSAGLKV